jgi:superfamily II DNA or RNA helicase
MNSTLDLFGLSISCEYLIKKMNGKRKLNTLLKILTIVEKNTPGKPKGSPLMVRKAYKYEISNNTIIFPRNKIFGFLKNNFIDESDININLNYEEIRTLNKFIATAPLYSYQEDILQHVMKNIFNDKYNKTCYLQLDTGLGKTRLGCAFINEINKTTIIVVPTIAIGFQWIDECNELYPELNIGFYNNKNKFSPDNYDALVIVINTFYKKDILFISKFGFIIFDEAHEYHSSQFGKSLWLAQTEYVLGLSATPEERPDGLDLYVQLHLGKPIYAKDITSLSKHMFKCEVKAIQYYGNPEFTNTITTSNGTTSTILTINNIIQDTVRIQLIINEIKLLYENNHGVLIFSEYRNFLDILKQYLLVITDKITILDDINDNDIGILRGGIKKEDILKIKKENRKIVLTTYGFSRRGISLIDMTALVLTTPRRNGIKQIIGRIMRKGSDENITRKIIDIIDMRSILKTQYNEREKIYMSRNYPIVLEKKEWNNINF